MMKSITVDIFQYTEHIGAVTVDGKKRFVYQPNGEQNLIYLQNLIASAQERIPGRLSAVQLLAKLPDYYKGVVFAEIRNESGALT